MRGFRGEEEAEVVDGTVTQRQEKGYQTDPVYQPAEQATQGRIYEVDQSQQYTPDASQQYDPSQYTPAGSGVDLTGLVDAGVGLASDPKNRTLALLVKVPVFAYVALSDRMPGVVRLAAAALGVMEALEAVQRQDDIQWYIENPGY